MRHILVTVKPESDRDDIRKVGDRFVVRTTAPAESGQANAAAVKLLRRYIEGSGQVRIVSGHRRPQKIFAISH